MPALSASYWLNSSCLIRPFQQADTDWQINNPKIHFAWERQVTWWLHLNGACLKPQRKSLYKSLWGNQVLTAERIVWMQTHGKMPHHRLNYVPDYSNFSGFLFFFLHFTLTISLFFCSEQELWDQGRGWESKRWEGGVAVGWGSRWRTWELVPTVLKAYVACQMKLAGGSEGGAWKRM